MGNTKSQIKTYQKELDELQTSKFIRIISQSLKSFFYAYAFKTIITILSNLKNIKKNPLIFIKLLFGKEQIKTGLFLGTYCFLMKISNKLLNEFSNHPNINSFLSGFFGGLISILFLNKNIRSIFGLYVATRSFDIIYEAYFKNKWFKDFKYDKTILMCFFLFFLGYAFAHEPGTMPKSMINFFVVMAREHENDKIFHQIWVHKANKELMKRGIEPYDPIKILYSSK
ncbi:hypothetical protein ABPG72_007309 [Tetrahymena utriculariae]